ncbi:MAG TPA: DUF1015 domain-containing protein [Phycisphaeraceae bacterium]
MPPIHPIPAVTYRQPQSSDLSALIAPPYDVLDEASKAALLRQSEHNIVVIDLPHLPPKTVGPDEAYQQAGQRYRQWLEAGVLERWQQPAVFVYQQTYTVGGQRYQRRGLIANLPTQPFGRPGGIHPHEQTFASAKEDRLKLMRATRAQLSPIFGIYADPRQRTASLMQQVIQAGPPRFHARTASDGVLHEVWAVQDPALISAFSAELADKDVFIADGHHRYTTALNYLNELTHQGRDPGGASQCLFVLVSMHDPGMIVLPTHRVLGRMPRFTMQRFIETAKGKLDIAPFPSTNLAELEEALRTHQGHHPIGLYDPTNPDEPLAIATTVSPDPLREKFPQQSEAWRQLDVAIVQHLIVEEICQPNFCEPSQDVAWKFPHELSRLEQETDGKDYQLGLILRPTPLEAVRQVSQAGELMPQKSTFFYPKLATGLVINPLD